MVGDLAVTPLSLMANCINELERLICRPADLARSIHPLPLRQVPADGVLRDCHTLRQRQREGRCSLNACMKILCDLADLNLSLQNRLNKNNVEFVITGDLLAGQANCRMDVLMEVLINCWSSNPVHGDKIAYTKIVMGLLSRLTKPS